MPQEITLSSLTRSHIHNLARNGKRVDGRDFEQVRPIKIRTGHIGKAEGSAEVWLGHTRVLAGVKLKPGVPYPDSPNVGTMTTSAEMNPLAAPNFEAGPPSMAAIELARVVDRGIRESGLIDFKGLCIEEGEKAWTVFIDFHVLDYDGNLFDACSIAGLTAVLGAKVPNVQYGISDKDGKLPLTTDNPPISITMAKLGDALLLDPGLDEDLVFDARLTVAVDDKGDIRAMQKGGGGSFSVDDVKTIIKKAQSRYGPTRELMRRAIDKGEASSLDS